MSARVAAVVFSYYPADPRVRREAEALEERGVPVDVICLRGEGQKAREQLGGITVHRLPLRRKRGGKVRYIAEYLGFLMMAFWKLSLLHIKNHYGLVHVHNMPDILVFSALVPRLTGAKVILDLHDPMPEVYMTKYGLTAGHPMIRMLIALEKRSIRWAHLVLTPNVAFRDLFIARGAPPEKVHIVMNAPQETIFAGAADVPGNGRKPNNSEFRIMFHGTIVERHGLDTALLALDRLRDQIPNAVFDVYGDGDFVAPFKELAARLGLADRVRHHGHVTLETIAGAIAGIDVGLIPNKKSPFTEINVPTRIFEYLSMGKNVIAPRTRGILDYFDEQSLHFFEAGDPASLAQTLYDVYRDTTRNELVLTRGIETYRKHRWERQRAHFLELVARLVGPETLKVPEPATAEAPAEVHAGERE
jgi:glycosyltransferase involved in cell wall biosynthesis